MLFKLFSIYDTKADRYFNPFTAEHNADALRQFQQVANDIQTQIGQFPEDFVLYVIGTFDTAIGQVSPIERLSLGVASEYVKSQSPSNS